jgi:hypothetical protein
MKTYEEVLKEIQGKVSVSKSGKKKKTFSRSDFDDLTKAYLNSYNATIKSCKMAGGEVVETDVMPVQAFRGFLKRIVSDFGVDKQEAEKVMNDYEITNVDGLYEIVSTLISNYLSADKKFDFIPQRDFTASIVMDTVAKTTKTHKGIKRQDGTVSPDVTVQTEAHRVVKAKSKAPKWLKKKK